ncbi:hypothetical protein [Luteibacter sp. 3190]|uniref:hypothetical protein n=1 Tax=Luteibacter sp. 3190 TaxID=2817736 RepID=UPI0028630BB3|nr:hypothetical protein [Luteibacter sp. 3190]MDR6936652.1 hypothetical protein [Luteibacter sp. 3190]
MKQMLGKRIHERQVAAPLGPIIATLHERLLASAVAPEFAEETRRARSGTRWERATATIKLIDLLRMARKLSAAARVFGVAQQCYAVAEEVEDEELSGIATAMHAIEQREKLGEDEYWPLGQGPVDYQRLVKAYDACQDRIFVRTFTDLGAPDLGRMFEADHARFERLSERGRREFFHRDDTFEVVADCLAHYLGEAERAARAQAFTAAVAMMGAAIESLLLLRCLMSPDIARRHVSGKTRRSDILARHLTDLNDACDKAGWLRAIDTPYTTILPSQLVALVRDWRNVLHPGRQARDSPWVLMDQEEYDLAHAVFVATRALLLSPREEKRLRAASSVFDAPDERACADEGDS